MMIIIETIEHEIIVKQITKGAIMKLNITIFLFQFEAIVFYISEF